LGKAGVEKILQISIKIQPAKDLRRVTDEICIDTTAQEKNITYPTDVKLRKKVIDKCVKIAKKEGVELRQSYKRTAKKLVLAQRFAHHPRNYKKAQAAKRKLKTIAGRLVRELQRKLPEDQLSVYQHELDLFTRAINQQKSDKDKIYSLHEPDVACIAKGKVAKKFEFGSKVSVALSKNRNIVLGVVNFKGNPHDSKTIEPTLEQVERLTGKKVQKAIVDRGYKTRRQFGTTEIIAPKPSKDPAKKTANRKRFRRRAAIEPVISHIKNQYRMDRNFLKGEIGDIINATMAGAAFNFKRWLNLKLKELSWLLEQLRILALSLKSNQSILCC
jgi:IS5 family transposase